MIELLLLLIGGRVIRRKWWVVGGLGLIWMAIGVFFFVNALSDEFRIPPTYFALPLAADACVSLVAGLNEAGARRVTRLGKSGVLFVIVLLIIEAPWHSDLLVGFLVGTILVVDACWRTASAILLRFPRWRRAIFLAGLEFLIGAWSFIPWPTNWQGEVGLDVGTLMIVTAFALCSLALRIRRLPQGAPVAAILAKSRLVGAPLPLYAAESTSQDRERSPATDIVVHVWTPTGGLAPIRRGIERYVAARDKKGVVSTGHAALEAPPDLYISHYPAVEMDREPAQFARALRATEENDVPGLFKPSYEEERAEWCPSTMQVRLMGLNKQALRDFWNAYRRDTTYNLTYRNCSSAVALALDAATDGHFAQHAASPLFILRLLFLPELWAAGLIRRRAAWMAWTPGLVLDYARALAHIVQFPAKAKGTSASASIHHSAP